MKKIIVVKKRNSNNSIFFKIIIVNFFILLSSCKSNFEHTYIKKDLIKISNDSYSRVTEYLNGNFYSFENKKKITRAIGLYFALSEDGNSTVFSYCEDYLMTCEKTLVKIKTKLRCEKIAKKTCYVIFFDNRLVRNEKIKIINNENDLKNEFLIFKTNLKSNHHDMRIPNASEVSDGSNWDS